MGTRWEAERLRISFAQLAGWPPSILQLTHVADGMASTTLALTIRFTASPDERQSDILVLATDATGSSTRCPRTMPAGICWPDG
jgi:hypothetical protein